MMIISRTEKFLAKWFAAFVMAGKKMKSWDSIFRKIYTLLQNRSIHNRRNEKITLPSYKYENFFSLLLNTIVTIVFELIKK